MRVRRIANILFVLTRGALPAGTAAQMLFRRGGAAVQEQRLEAAVHAFREAISRDRVSLPRATTWARCCGSSTAMRSRKPRSGWK